MRWMVKYDFVQGIEKIQMAMPANFIDALWRRRVLLYVWNMSFCTFVLR